MDILTRWMLVLAEPTIIQTASAVVTAFATVVLGVVTWVLARETKALSRASSQAHVTATIEPNTWAVNYADLHVSNSGNAAAYDIALTFEPPLPGAKNHRREFGTPLQNISLLRPGQALQSSLCEFAQVSKQTYRVTVRWKRRPSDRRFEKMTYDLSMKDYEGVSYLGGRSPVVTIAEQLKKLREDWQNVARGSLHIKTDVFTAADRSARRRDIEELLSEPEELQDSKPDSSTDH